MPSCIPAPSPLHRRHAYPPTLLCPCSNQAPRRTPPKQHLAALKRLTGVPAEDVLAAQWIAHLHRPAHYVAIDRSRQMVVVCVRGTLQVGHAASLVCCTRTAV